MLRRRTKRRLAFGTFAALATVMTVGTGPVGAASPTLTCKLAGALARVPAKPVWFPAPQPVGTTLVVDAAAPPAFAHGLKWTVENRYFWLVRLPRGAKVADPKAKLVFNARFPNLGRAVDVLRRTDGRLYARFKTTGSGPDTTVAVASNVTSTEFGDFVASLQKVRYPSGC
jgi:hypothetical protein